MAPLETRHDSVKYPVLSRPIPIFRFHNPALSCPNDPAKSPICSHQSTPEVSLPGGFVDAREQLVKVCTFLRCLLPERVRPAHVPCCDDRQQSLVLDPPVLLKSRVCNDQNLPL